MLKTLAILALLATTCYAHPEGPPEEACEDRTPNHGVPPQDSESPYELDIHVHDDHFDGKSRLLIALNSCTFCIEVTSMR
jgi:hypothetical protein